MIQVTYYSSFELWFFWCFSWGYSKTPYIIYINHKINTFCNYQLFPKNSSDLRYVTVSYFDNCNLDIVTVTEKVTNVVTIDSCY